MSPGDEAKPYPKAAQLARGARRYRRKVASPKSWQAIIDAKIGPCRVCCDPGRNGSQWGRIQMHHIVPRDLGGDDVADNVLPLCGQCHDEVTRRNPDAMRLLAESLTDAEYAYAIERCGEGALERLYRVGR